MKDVTICFVHFGDLTLRHFEAALYSVRQQDFSFVDSLVIVDNSSRDTPRDLARVVAGLEFPVPVRLRTYKHDNPERTHAWSTNITVRQTYTPSIFFTRSDYLLNRDTLQLFLEQQTESNFVTSYGCHLSIDLDNCELSNWRERGVPLRGEVFRYTTVDTGVWLTTRKAFDSVGGLDERLTAWGHAQTHFQWKLHKMGLPFVCIPEVLFFHQQHGGEKDMQAANLQLKAIGVDLREMWARFPGIY